MREPGRRVFRRDEGWPLRERSCLLSVSDKRLGINSATKLLDLGAHEQSVCVIDAASIMVLIIDAIKFIGIPE